MQKAQRQAIELKGFNNLSKSLSIQLYRLCYTQTQSERDSFIAFTSQQYNAVNLAQLLSRVAKIIDAQVINSSVQDYKPFGASATLMLAEDAQSTYQPSVVAHLDKSHIAAHSYPDIDVPYPICTFRLDIELSTCGLVLPFLALESVFAEFECDVANIDYKVRGFTRDTQGNKHFADHSVIDFTKVLPENMLEQYFIEQQSFPNNTYACRLKRKSIGCHKPYLVRQLNEISDTQAKQAKLLLNNEMSEIFLAC